MKNANLVEKDTKNEYRKEKVNRLIYGTIASSLITYIIVMTVIAMVLGFITYGFTMFQINENHFDSDEAIFVFLCFHGLNIG